MSLPHTIGRGLAGLLLGAGATLALAAPASATGDDFLHACQSSDVSCQNGVEVTSGVVGPFNRCETAPDLTEVCVGYDGDIVFVKDGQSDSHSAIALITASSGLPTRICRNPHGNGTWARCNFDWVETATKRVSGGEKVSYEGASADFLWSFSNN